MSKILDRLKKVKRHKKTRVVSPTIEYIHKRKKASKLKIFVFFMVVIVIGAGIFLLLIVNKFEDKKSKDRLKFPASRIEIAKKPKKTYTEKEHVKNPIAKKPATTIPQSDNASKKKDIPPQTDKKVKEKIEEPPSKSIQESSLKKQKNSIVSNPKTKKQEATKPSEKDNLHKIKENRTLRNVYLYRARTYEKIGQYDKAIEQYKKALTLDGNNIYILKKLGEIYVLTDQCEHAMTFLQKAFKRGALDEEVLNNLGLCEMKAGNISMAEEYLMMAERKGSVSGVLYYNLGILYLKQKKYPSAENYLSKAVESSDDKTKARALLGLATVKEAQKKYNEALTLYMKLVENVNLSKAEQRFVSERLKILMGLQKGSR